MALPKVGRFNTRVYTVTMADVSTASSAFVPVAFRCKVVRAYLAIANAITTADSALTAKITGTAITGMTGTAAFTSSAAGTVFTMADSAAANIANDGDVIELISDGASSTTAIGTWTVVVHEF
jgi:hypothetical protein